MYQILSQQGRVLGIGYAKTNIILIVLVLNSIPPRSCTRYWLF